MRKYSTLLESRIIQLALVLLALSACDRAETRGGDSAIATTVSASPQSAVGNMAGTIGTGAGRGEGPAGAPAVVDEARALEKAMMRDQVMQLEPPMAPPAPTSARVAASRGDRSDPSLGMPLPSIDPTGAMLVRQGRASVEVKAVDEAVTLARQAASQFGGFVANTAVQAGKEDQRSAMLQLRVPSAQFDGLVAALSRLGKVESVSVSAEDVAEEYVDLGARAANARRVEARLVELLATRTGRLSDVLTVEQELARVRQETERYDARMRWLERRATLSSLDIVIHEKVPLIDSPRGHGPIAEAFAEAWTRLVGVLAWCIASLGILVPVGVIVGLGVLAARRLRGGGPKGGELVS